MPAPPIDIRAWRATQSDILQSLMIASATVLADRYLTVSDDDDLPPLSPYIPTPANRDVRQDFEEEFEGFEGFKQLKEFENLQPFENDEIDNIELELDREYEGFDDEFEPFGENFESFDENFEAFDENLEAFDDAHEDEPRPFDENIDVPPLNPPLTLQTQLDLDDLEDVEDSENDELYDEVGDLLVAAALTTLAIYVAGMRGPYHQILKSKDWFRLSMNWPVTWFRRVYRMSQRTFWRVVALLKERPIFQPKGNARQRPVSYQLACFLIRFGTYGGVGFDATTKLSLGVGTVYLYCKRVTRALREVGLECLAWPDDMRKEEIKPAFEKISGIPGCIGAADGTLVELRSKPRVEGDEFITYKGFIGVNMFCVVDHKKRFIAHDGGWPGSKNDQTTFRESRVWQCRGALIKEGERLLVDKGFFISPYTIRPYGKREINTGTRAEKKNKREFNSRFSKARIVVEHAFGLVKKRFPAVDYMSTAINIQNTHRVLEALLTLHNLCIDYRDSSRSSTRDNDDALARVLHRFPGHINVSGLPEGGWGGYEDEDWLRNEGKELREELREISQEWADGND